MSDFIKTLLKEIDEVQELYNHHTWFISEKNLTQFKIRKNASSKDLPIELFLGTVYLIGPHGSIFESYSWVDPSYSLTPMINMHKPMWLNTVYIHKLEMKDFPYDFYAWVRDKTEINIRDKPSKLEEFVLLLLYHGVQIWLPSKR